MENTQNLIGRKFKGFKFESTDELSYMKALDANINKILTIKDAYHNDVWAEFGIYPLKDVLNNLIPEETEIPKLPNYTLQELKEKIGHDFNLID
jgi:hypothetical protein